MSKLYILLVAALLGAGCATNRTPPPPPLTMAAVVELAKAGTPDEEIMRRIDETFSVFRLNSDDVVKLRQDGVSARVVDYMLLTATRADVLAERRRTQQDFYFYYRYGLPYYGYRTWWRCW